MGNIFNNDFQDFIKALNLAKVDYVLVGAYSVILHGYHRVTGDMDIWVRKTEDNYKKIVTAFSFFGMPVFDMTKDKFLSSSEFSEVFRFGISPSRIDLMTYLKGLEFEEVYAQALVHQVEGLEVKLINYNHLIEAKKASAREKDWMDIKNLEENKKLNKAE